MPAATFYPDEHQLHVLVLRFDVAHVVPDSHLKLLHLCCRGPEIDSGRCFGYSDAAIALLLNRWILSGQIQRR